MNVFQNSKIPVQATNENEQNEPSFPAHVSLNINSVQQCESTQISNALGSSCTKCNTEAIALNENSDPEKIIFFNDHSIKTRTDVDEIYQIDQDLNTKKYSIDPKNELTSDKNSNYDNEISMTVDEINQNLIYDLNLAPGCLHQDSRFVVNKNSVINTNNKTNTAIDEIYQIDQDIITDSTLTAGYLNQSSILNSDNAIINNDNEINKINSAALAVRNNSVCSSANTELHKFTSATCSECSEQEAPSNLSSDELCEKHFQCNFCNKKFSNKQNCDRHYRTHTNDKPYECNVCGRRFPFQRSRDRHYRTHTNEKAYECNICKKRFSRNQGLKSHMLTHTKEKPHQCEICNKRFPRIGSLRQHYRLHTKERPYDCEACGNSFSLKRNRDKHFRVVHMNEKPFQCKECSKKFSSQKTLQCHFTTHTNEKPYLCDVCNKRYSHKASLTLHCKQHLSCKDINILTINHV